MLKLGKEGGPRWLERKAMFLFLVPGSHFTVNRAPLLGIYPEGTEIDYHAHIDMKTATGEIVPWLASQTDMLAGLAGSSVIIIHVIAYIWFMGVPSIIYEPVQQVQTAPSAPAAHGLYDVGEPHLCRT